jgi:uncharacterized protein (DUF302 family)
MVFEEVVALSMPFDEALERTKAALAEQGFGTLTEIDMQATMRAKIGKEMDRYVIVGACNPHLASRALDVEPQIGVLLPCNVVVREAGGQVLVEAMDPGLMATMVGDDSLRPVADEARSLINAALATLTSVL